MHRHPLLLACLCAVLLLPSAASASTTLGTSPEVALPTTPLAGCAPALACTVAQERLANLDLNVPDTGVVVRWRVHGSAGQVRLRRVGGGATAPAALPASAGAVEQTAQLPVRSGDLLALDLLDGAQVSREPSPFISGADMTSTWTPPLADGETRAPSASFEGYWLFEAEIEPDADGDGRGDETQDPDHGMPPGQPSNPVPPTPPAPPTAPSPPTPDLYAGLPAAGPALKLAATAAATRQGVVTVSLANPYAFKLTGRATLRQGRSNAATTKVTLAAASTRLLRLRLAKAAARTLARRRTLKLILAVTLRAPVGKARTTTRAVVVKLGAVARRAPPRSGGGTGGGSRGDAPSGGGAGFDGTYRAPDGQTMVVANGFVTTFNGDLTLYCTKSGRQTRTSYAMIADDPDPKVAADGSFTWEATRGYGFEKLRFDGRIQGDAVTGRLMVEDRSPLLGGDRIEFDYCFAGKQFRLTR
ncbi:hypothetical protein [Conexibacter sp. CPCC 206217]|uniref:hypothetical protein n=1 Tax=Conexibacter sp. CPCC 206217 TaxID=3064574 RepID=UPI00272230EF|nr:hypothetical protein [Conexibacter sp. CPCC 206217]MDO8211273.1 hypothetical protein [Conexibacter sp. CPCC 206217]